MRKIKSNTKTIPYVKIHDRFKMISLGLSCLLAASETMALDTTLKSNGLIHAIKMLKEDIKDI